MNSYTLIRIIPNPSTNVKYASMTNKTIMMCLSSNIGLKVNQMVFIHNKQKNHKGIFEVKSIGEVDNKVEFELQTIIQSNVSGEIEFDIFSTFVEVFELKFVPAPSSSTSSGLVNNFSYDVQHFYLCVGTNQWKRISFSSW